MANLSSASAAAGSAEPVDAAIAARAMHLRYVSDRKPGISRQRAGKEFMYRDAAGMLIKNRDELARIGAIAIPPAWTDVWICPHPNGHIQATGRDARGRKQYRYHLRWRGMREETKFEHMLVFARALPVIRRQVDGDLARSGLPREKVLAAVVRLMERTLARVGNPEYARENESFGLTTLKNRHARVIAGRIELDFRAKSGIHHHSVVSDQKLARIVRNCRDLPGSELFQYIGEDGNRHSIDSGDVNEYLRTISGCDVTAKDFRTWAGTNLAVLALHELNERKPTKRGMLRVVQQVAEELRNTPAVCRKAYIHPAVMECYLEGTLQLKWPLANDDQASEMLAVEREVIRFLDERLRIAKIPLATALKASVRSAKAKPGVRHRGQVRQTG